MGRKMCSIMTGLVVAGLARPLHSRGLIHLQL